MRKWVTAGILSLQAALSQAADQTTQVTHSSFPENDFGLVLLGRDLFHDPILSGNRNIACATCHHVTQGSADAQPLGIGEGGMGLGHQRQVNPATPLQGLVPRNAPALWNAGASEFTTMFHDGRVAKDSSAPFGFAMPDGAALEASVPNALAAQAMLPPTSHEEMAGAPGENEIADAVAAGRIRGPNGAWALLAERVEAIPSYRRRFTLHIGPRPILMTDIATAISSYEAYEFRATDSAFDAYLAGREDALTPPQKRGLDIFYGKAKCATCHSGPFQTDHDFHAIAMPQIGPGKGHGGTDADHGRAAVTGRTEDLYCFRTPSLRNVAQTAPYGHAGAYSSLEDVVRHHLNPQKSLALFNAANLSLPALDGSGRVAVHIPDPTEIARISAANELEPVTLSQAEFNDLIRFLHALSDPQSVIGRLGSPARVPSGLDIDKLSVSSDRY
ncbi:cytochrome-c peroxidase [Rhodalgimonas zhirmunskyi]|uniref:Cytochrome-c peroxidase n=1 Tax=Rhodalgimonas zhirmunskyi TaxID=2964767 RepID=A0AAJ1UBI7_9RHOB|nr:cytochrome c peroxidase [Rhodoalgimonas zhirmunskyi]MDQ2092862.1 cytochrome-c peroxidase [Rhodoalgimonas zhirmunskyi]